MLRLLYVDDDADLRDLAVFALDLDGDIATSVAESGVAALRVMAATPQDAVLLDVMMPDMDGPGVLAAMRLEAHTADIPVIFITARVLPDEQQRLTSFGAAGVISKPFDPMTLASDIRAILGGRDA